jgi:hypothetical protein
MVFCRYWTSWTTGWTSEPVSQSPHWFTHRSGLWNYGSEYLQGTAEGMERVMWDWPGFIKEGGHVWLTTGSLSLENQMSFPPFLEIFTKKVF